MSIKLVAVDIDGTLLRSDQTVSAKTKQAVTRALAAGIQICISTGRTLLECREILAEFPQIRYISYSGGAIVRDLQTGETIYDACLTPRQALAIYERLKPYHKFFCYFTGGGVYYPSAVWRYETAYKPEWVAHIRRFYTPVDDFAALLKQNDKPVEKLFLIFPDQAERDRAWDAVPAPQLYVTASSPDNLEISAAQANKGASLDALRRHLGLSQAQTMAIGDSENDLRMLGYAAVAVVMANADKELKKIAAVIAPSNDEDGVAWTLDQVVEGKI